MPDVRLLSNGKYHATFTSEGTGWSRWNGLAVTRWRDDGVLNDGGSSVYLGDARRGLPRIPHERPSGPKGEGFGLERRGDQLRIRPLLPRDWQTFDLRYRFCNSTDQITCRETDSADPQVTVDGVTVPGGSLTLIDDGKTNAVVVDMHRTPNPCPPDLKSGRGEQVCSSE